MSTDRKTPESPGAEEIAVLARMAGITIGDGELVAEMLAAVSSAAENLLAFPDADVTGVAEAFDPAWPQETRGNR